MDILQTLYDEMAVRVPPYRLGLAFAFVLGGLVIRRIVLYMLDRYVARVARLSRTELDDLVLKAIAKPIGAAILVVGLYLATQSFAPREPVSGWVDGTFSVLVIGLLTWVMLRLVGVLVHLLHRWAQATDSALDDQLVPLVGRAAQVTVVILAALMVLQNMGYSVSGLIAGLGVGGLAVALAAQKTLADVFGSAMLLVDRPFVVGDWIRSPDRDVEGVVERVGFRSTRIRTFDRSLVSVPNSRLADFVIDNVTSRPARRVWITVRVPHHASADQMRESVHCVEEIVSGHPGVDQDSFLLVKFVDFGTYSRDIMVYYFTKPTAWVDHLEIREEINLQILESLEGMGLSVALPTQTVSLIREDRAAGQADGPGNTI